MEMRENNPNFLNIVLKYRVISKRPLASCIKWVEDNLDGYIEFLQNRYNPRPPAEIQEKYIVRELQFRGFIPSAVYTRTKGAYYIISKCNLLNVQWILPIEGGHTSDQLSKGMPEIYDLQSRFGLANWTRVDINYKL